MSYSIFHNKFYNNNIMNIIIYIIMFRILLLYFNTNIYIYICIKIHQ